jgi:hypothetical protein
MAKLPNCNGTVDSHEFSPCQPCLIPKFSNSSPPLPLGHPIPSFSPQPVPTTQPVNLFSSSHTQCFWAHSPSFKGVATSGFRHPPLPRLIPKTAQPKCPPLCSCFATTVDGFQNGVAIGDEFEIHSPTIEIWKYLMLPNFHMAVEDRRLVSIMIKMKEFFPSLYS